MNRELIIDSRASEVDIVLLEDKLLVELHKEKTNNNYAVGDIYLGKVRKIMPGLNAAFVDVGYEKDAFLHYLDLGPQIRSLNKYVKLSISGKPENITMDNFRPEPDIEKTGKITQVLASGAQILVQIAKEPISTKGPRISSEISFAGRYLVLVPFSSRISVSQKIRSSEERNRLKRLIQSIKPNNYGVIIRTVAENKKVAELDADLRSLIEKWEKTTEKLQHAKPPAKIMSELDRTSAILRDLLNESFNSVHVNDPNLYEEIKSFIHTIAPQKTDIVKLYKGRTPIFDFFGVDKQIKSLFGKTVSIRSGVYLIIEHTEAMHVIDVNSGHRVNKENSQEENALEVNLEAAVEIARQLRLRDMGGIIVIDFIDMHDSKHRRELYQKLKEEMARDHAKHTILPPSKFGLVQITRQRVRPEMNVEILESCPVCEGTGKIKPSILFVDEIENNLKYLIQDQNEKQITLAVHPFIFAYLTKGPISVRTRWMWKYKKVFTIKAMKNYHMLDYRFFNQNNDELAI
ncbi:MAG: Rne/Rng family ribonuclease [Bacteroidales bacterium]|nr:Rne/Rng family ribonuclease [Bacteroidales bacterium]MDD3699999.1 Rne/Rng family ribonuclease [Bacteroidales bacterium]MDY0368771.1 Rne/Rng family ribonuclease [Bacteroidales bacterium]